MFTISVCNSCATLFYKSILYKLHADQVLHALTMRTYLLVFIKLQLHISSLKKIKCVAVDEHLLYSGHLFKEVMRFFYSNHLSYPDF